MSHGRRSTLLDVFAAGPLEGNALTVVHDADGLDDDTMLRFARETRLSETTFVQTATDPGADYRNRIWTMSGELPFAGHPSLGTAVAVARARGERSARYTQQTPAGLQPVDVERTGEDRARASVVQEPAEFGAEVDAGAALAAAGLPAEVAHAELPAQFVSTGVAQLIVPVRAAGDLRELRPDWPAVEDALGPGAGVVLYLAAPDPDAATAHARGLFPGGGGTENPATGSAAGPLMAYLHQRAGARKLRITQGVEMGRPSVLDCAVVNDRVRVGGEVVVLMDGRLLL